MYGAILGDMIGCPYEFDRGGQDKGFSAVCQGFRFSDDSVMSIAVAEALMDAAGKPEEEILQALTASMQKWGHRYPRAGYGGRFRGWLNAKDPQPYNSCGNGSAIRPVIAVWIIPAP